MGKAQLTCNEGEDQGDPTAGTGAILTIKAREPKLGRPVWLSGILPLLVAGGLFPAAAQAAWSITLYANNQVDCSDAQGDALLHDQSGRGRCQSRRHGSGCGGYLSWLGACEGLRRQRGANRDQHE
jgi:hypothetical protein